MNRRLFSILGLTSISLALTGAYWMGRARAAGIPAKGALFYEGWLSDPTGKPLPTPQNIQVRLWSAEDDADAGSAADPLCSDGPKAYPLSSDGAFRIALPDKCTDAVRANPDVWVEVIVGGASLGRAKMGAVPYAVEADRAAKATSVAWGGVSGVPSSVQGIADGAIHVGTGGLVAIGTNKPKGKLTITDSAQTDPNGLPANSIFLGHVHAPNGWDATGICATGSSGTDMCAAVNGNTWYWGTQVDASTMNSLMYLQSTGNLTITGTLAQSSSAALKRDIHFLDERELDEVLRTVEATPVASYRYKSAPADSKVNYGVIAEKTPALLRSEDERGVNLSNTVGALLASVKAQQAQIAKLESRVRKLEGHCTR